jgi:hypothetical protein
MTFKKCEFSVASDPKIAHLLYPSKVHVFASALGVSVLFSKKEVILDTYKMIENIMVSCLNLKWKDISC